MRDDREKFVLLRFCLVQRFVRLGQAVGDLGQLDGLGLQALFPVLQFQHFLPQARLTILQYPFREFALGNVSGRGLEFNQTALCIEKSGVGPFKIAKLPVKPMKFVCDLLDGGIHRKRCEIVFQFLGLGLGNVIEYRGVQNLFFSLADKPAIGRVDEGNFAIRLKPGDQLRLPVDDCRVLRFLGLQRCFNLHSLSNVTADGLKSEQLTVIVKISGIRPFKISQLTIMPHKTVRTLLDAVDRCEAAQMGSQHHQIIFRDTFEDGRSRELRFGLSNKIAIGAIDIGKGPVERKLGDELCLRVGDLLIAPLAVAQFCFGGFPFRDVTDRGQDRGLASPLDEDRIVKNEDRTAIRANAFNFILTRRCSTGGAIFGVIGNSLMIFGCNKLKINR